MSSRSRPLSASTIRLQDSVPDEEVRPRDRWSQAVVVRVLLDLHETQFGSACFLAASAAAKASGSGLYRNTVPVRIRRYR